VNLYYRKDFTPHLAFEHSTTYYPSFEGFGDYRLLISNAAEVPLNGSKTWKLKFGIRNDYDSMPNPGVEKLDTTYFTNLVVALE
jgi:hypothetical protein